MSADDHLGTQFMSVHELMSPRHWDRNMGTPVDLYAAEKPYIDQMADHIREHGAGSLGPVQLRPGGLMDDGHHRTLAAYYANEWNMPVEHIR